MTTTAKKTPNAFIVLNPVAGVVNVQFLKRAIEARFHSLGWTTRFHVTEQGESTPAIVARELNTGIDLVVAAGGDGTIAAVAAGMAQSHIPLGIIPTGTWNAIARNLQLPFSTLRAINLMCGKHNIKKLDLMQVGENLHAMNLSMGISASMIKSTSRGDKRKLGLIAYFTRLIHQAFGWQMHRYAI